MNESPASNSENTSITVVRDGGHWLAFLSVFGLSFMSLVATAAWYNSLTGSALLANSLSNWAFIVIFSAIVGKVLTLSFHDKITLASDGLIIYGSGRTRRFNWSDFGGLRETLVFGNVVLTYASRGYYGVPISRTMGKAVLEHPSRPKEWYLPPLIIEYINNTGKIPKGLSWHGRMPTAEEDRADQSKPYFYRQKTKEKSTLWVGFVYSIIALALIIAILLFVH